MLRHTKGATSRFAEIREELGALPDCPISGRNGSAPCVYERLSGRSSTASPCGQAPHLLIAAAAEAADVTLLFYDNYDLIDITGQPMRWLAPQGSLR